MSTLNTAETFTALTGFPNTLKILAKNDIILREEKTTTKGPHLSQRTVLTKLGHSQVHLA